MLDRNFWQGKKILVTGHTGFKGTWLCKLLHMLGAQVTGYALRPPTEKNLWELSGMEGEIRSVMGDVRDLDHLRRTFAQAEPVLAIHLAAQPIVRESYRRPVYTYEVNVMGTVNVLECVRETKSLRSFLNVTTDKVYLNREWSWGYRENEELNGFDPYSNSKSCSELVTAGYRNSFFGDGRVALSTARAGNVIGGGDFAPDRIVPDCVRAAAQGEQIVVRNPRSVRPYQHVLEPVCAYLLVLQEQYAHPELEGCYNIGPEDCDCLTTGELATLFCEAWTRRGGSPVSWVDKFDGGPHEANFLKLDCAKIRQALGWRPVWHVKQAIDRVVEFSRTYLEGGDVGACMEAQITAYLQEMEAGRLCRSIWDKEEANV